MKIEKLNENQIRCILSRSDLEQRKLRLSELARGSDKAQAFFQDMMEQASVEFGFEANNIPLMIEAIPLSGDCLILVVTKVEDPDTLAHHFSNLVDSLYPENDGEGFYSLMNGSADVCFDEDAQADETAEDYEEEPEDYEGEEDYEEASDSPQSEEIPETGETAEPEHVDLLEAFSEAIVHARQELLKQRKKKEEPEAPLCRIYSFLKLDDVISYSRCAAPFFEGLSCLYRDSAKGAYYLVLSQKEAGGELFSRACTLASDYGRPLKGSEALLSYYREHYISVLKEGAIETLSAL